MNVLHISPRLSPGGVNQLAADLAVGLQQAGFRNTVISPANELVGRMAAVSVQHHAMRSVSLFTYKREIKRIALILQNSKVDVILTYTTQATYLAWMASKDMPEESRPRLIGVYSSYPQDRGWMLSLECCDALIATSQHLRYEMIRRAKPDAHRQIWVIPHGVNEEHCTPAYKAPAAWLEQWQRSRNTLDTRTLKICAAGAITPLHGLDDIPAILDKLRQAGVPAHVYIAGDTARARQRYINSIQQQLKNKHTESMVTWLGNRTDLRDVISVCDVMISLSRKPACYDRAVLEALSLGKPVAGYDHGIVGELLDVYLPEGRVAPGDIDGIVARLEQWQAYRPVLEGSLLHPFRLSDTIRGVAELCAAVCQGRQESA